MFPQGVKTPSSQTLHFMRNSPFRGKGKAIFKGNLSLRWKIFPLRDNLPNFPWEGKVCPKKCLGNLIRRSPDNVPLRDDSPNFPWEGKVCPKRCLGNSTRRSPDNVRRILSRDSHLWLFWFFFGAEQARN